MNSLLYLNFVSITFILTLHSNGILDYLVTLNTFDTLPGAWSSEIYRILKVLLGMCLYRFANISKEPTA
jgi:hypothetical protein